MSNNLFFTVISFRIRFVVIVNVDWWRPDTTSWSRATMWLRRCTRITYTATRVSYTATWSLKDIQMFECKQSWNLWWNIDNFIAAAFAFWNTFSVVIISQVALCTITSPNTRNVLCQFNHFLFTQYILACNRCSWTALLQIIPLINEY